MTGPETGGEGRPPLVENGEPDRTPERPERDRPRIYVADLSAYNHSILRGIWIDATIDVDDMWEQINAMLASSPIPGAEEFAIHDYDNLGPVALSEYESIPTVAKIGRGFLEHGRAFLHWVAHIGTNDPEQMDQFEDHFLGHYTDLAELGEDLADSHGLDQVLDDYLPDFIRPYVTVDYAAFGADLTSGTHVTTAEDGIYVFDA